MGGIASAAGGGKGGGGTSGGGYSNLTEAIQRAGGISAEFTQKAIDSLNQYYNTAQQQYGNYYNMSRSDIQNANVQTQNILQSGFAQGTQALLSGQQQAGTYLAPYLNAGLPALDAYSQSMGLGTPVGGSLQAFNQQQAAATAQQNANMAIGDKYNQDLSAYNQRQNDIQNQLNSLNYGAPAAAGPQGTASAPGSQGVAPAGGQYVYDANTGIATRAAQGATGIEDLKKMAMEISKKWNPNAVPGINAWAQSGNTAELVKFIQGAIDSGHASKYAEDRSYGDSLQSRLGSAKYSAPIAAATQNLGSNIAPDQAQYIPAQTPIAPAPEMTSNAEGAKQGLQNFYASPLAQALYGGNPMDMSTQSVQERFKNDPGYQFQLQQGLNATQNNALARGQAYSPSMQLALNNYAQGQAATGFDAYRNSLANTFTQYQNQLQTLSGMGGTAAAGGATLAQQTGQSINNNVTNLATGQANVNAASAQQTAGNAMTAGQNVATMAQNQGNALANAYTGEGNNQMNAAISAGQSQAAQSQYQNSAQANGMGQLSQGIGAAGSLMSLFGSSSGGSAAGGAAGGSSSGGGGGLGGAGKGAASGAAAGSMFGPWGAAIGGVAGGVLGYFQK